jgi:hypothetical protein
MSQQVQLLLHGLCKLLQLLPGRSINLAVSSPIRVPATTCGG